MMNNESLGVRRAWKTVQWTVFSKERAAAQVSYQLTHFRA